MTKNATSKIMFPSFFLVIQALFMEEINIILMNENVDEEDAIENMCWLPYYHEGSSKLILIHI